MTCPVACDSDFALIIFDITSIVVDFLEPVTPIAIEAGQASVKSISNHLRGCVTRFLFQKMCYS